MRLIVGHQGAASVAAPAAAAFATDGRQHPLIESRRGCGASVPYAASGPGATQG